MNAKLIAQQVTEMCMVPGLPDSEAEAFAEAVVEWVDDYSVTNRTGVDEAALELAIEHYRGSHDSDAAYAEAVYSEYLEDEQAGVPVWLQPVIRLTVDWADVALSLQNTVGFRFFSAKNHYFGEPS